MRKVPAKKRKAGSPSPGGLMGRRKVQRSISTTIGGPTFARSLSVGNPVSPIIGASELTGLLTGQILPQNYTHPQHPPGSAAALAAAANRIASAQGQVLTSSPLSSPFGKGLAIQAIGQRASLDTSVGHLAIQQSGVTLGDSSGSSLSHCLALSPTGLNPLQDKLVAATAAARSTIGLSDKKTSSAPGVVGMHVFQSPSTSSLPAQLSPIKSALAGIPIQLSSNLTHSTGFSDK